jgi:hypothetical protein
LESITGTNLAVMNTLDEVEQARLREFVQALVGGKTLVLLGSRGSEEWLLGDQVTVTSEVTVTLARTYNLPGLDAEAASTLAERILERYGKTAYRSDADHRDAFRELLKLLDGYPLALEVVLANLQRQTPTEVLTALQEADVNLDPNAEAGDKTQSIVQCIEYSHSNLSPAAQELLLCLAPFTGVVRTEWLGNYVKQLQQQPQLAHLDHSLWNDVLQEAVNWGLLTPHEIGGGYLRLQPVFPYFLKTRIREEGQGTRDEADGSQTRKAAIEAAFRAHYDGIGGVLAQMIKSKESQERQLGQNLVGIEFENLMSALKISLVTGSSFASLYMPLMFYIDTRQDHQQGLLLGHLVMDHLESNGEDRLSAQTAYEYVGVLDDIANRHLQMKSLLEAVDTYR